MFSYLSPEERVPANHPLRPIRLMVEQCEIPQNRNIRAHQLTRFTGGQAQSDR